MVARRSMQCMPSVGPRSGRSWLLAAMVTFLFRCSLLFDPSIDQCETNADCEKLRSGSVCDVAHHVCVTPMAAVPDGGASGAGGRGVDPTGGADAACLEDAMPRSLFASGCTESVCIPFDNASRLTRFSPDGTLTPLPATP